MGFTNITDEDVQPHKARYVKVRKKLRKLDRSLDERWKAIPSSSTTDAEAIEMIEMTSKDIDTSVNDVELDVRFNILFVFFIGLDVRFLFCLMFGLIFITSTILNFTSGLSFLSLRLTSKLVPMLKPGDDISILFL